MEIENSFAGNPLNDVWALKYRPTTLDDIILPERLKNTFRKFIENGNVPNLLLCSSSPGTGKTSIAKILAYELDACILEINGSQERGIDIIRGRITTFVQNKAVGGNKKIVFIDEADGLTPDAQNSLKSFIEEFSEVARFIFTANDEYAFIDAIRSRFQKIYFEVDSEEYQEMINLFTERVVSILTKEDIKHDEKIVFKVIVENFPDYRECWQVLNSIYNSYGEITKNINITKKSIITLIGAIDTKDLKVIRNTMAELSNIDYRNIYSKLMERCDEFKSYTLDNLIFTLADWNYKNNFVADKYLNFLGMCADLIMNSGA